MIKARFILLWLFTFFAGLSCQAQIDTIITVAGVGVYGDSGEGGASLSAEIIGTSNVVFDKQGNYYFPESPYNRVRKISPAGIITNFAGTGSAGYSGDGGSALLAELNSPLGLAIDDSNNLYISETNNNIIRKINIGTGIISTYAGNGMGMEAGDGGLATDASIFDPRDLCFDFQGNLYISDGDNKIRKVTTASGIITTVAGKGGVIGFSGDGGPADSAQLNGPEGICTDTVGNLFIADLYNDRIRRVDAVTGTITTIAGGDLATYNGEGLAASSAQLNPWKLKFDTHGQLYIVDHSNWRVRRIDISGNIYTVAGTGIQGFSGDCGPADSAELYFPLGIGFDSLGNLYIDEGGPTCRIREVVYHPSTATIAITAATDTVCADIAVTYSATVTGGNAPAYQWTVNGRPVGTGNDTLLYAPASGDSVRCTLYNAGGCTASQVMSSNAVAIVVTPSTTPHITISSSIGDSICAGMAATFTATVSGGGTSPTYQWIKNGSVVSSAATYSYTPANGDSVSCLLTGSNTCTVPPTVSSTTLHMVVSPVAILSVSITATATSVCAGTLVTFTAAGSGGGLSPTFHWIKNGSAAGTGHIYSYIPGNGDSVRCVITGSSACEPAGMMSSATIVMSVTPVMAPSVSIAVSPSDTLCSKGIVTCTAIATNGGTSPAYHWLLDGATSGTDDSTFAFTATGLDSVRCLLTGSSACIMPAIAGSNSIMVVVDSPVAPTIFISGPLYAPEGTTVTLTATLTNAGSSYSINWWNNGILIGITSVPSLTYTKGAGTDIITAQIIQQSFHCNDSVMADSLVLPTTDGIATITASTITIYPNPAHNEVNISGYGIAVISVTNTVGQTQLTQQAGTVQTTISTAPLPTGIYLLTVLKNDGTKVITKLIKE